jgi:hypothetical protein
MSEGKKFDNGKPMLALLPVRAVEDVGRVLTFGASKYDPWNWSKGMAWSRLISASLRHLFAFMRGEDRDPETGISHLAHAACCLLFLLEYTYSRREFDDRNKLEETSPVSLTLSVNSDKM